MALKRLAVQEMSQISKPWVTPGDAAHAAIAQVPALMGLLPQLVRAHEAIMALRSPEADSRVAEWSVEQSRLDARHDALVRGMWNVLDALAELAELDADQRDELVDLRDWLLPEGLSHMQKSYRGEAGHAGRIAAQLDDERKARLRAVRLSRHDLLDFVNEWTGVAARLGELEEVRARIAPPATSTAAETNAARLGWVRVTNAFVGNAELVDLAPEADLLIFGALRQAERAADARARRPVAPPAGPSPTPAAT